MFLDPFAFLLSDKPLHKLSSESPVSLLIAVTTD